MLNSLNPYELVDFDSFCQLPDLKYSIYSFIVLIISESFTDIYLPLNYLNIFTLLLHVSVTLKSIYNVKITSRGFEKAFALWRHSRDHKKLKMLDLKNLLSNQSFSRPSNDFMNTANVKKKSNVPHIYHVVYAKPVTCWVS